LLIDRTKISVGDRIIERQLMCLLIAMYERAFIRYADQTDDFKKEQWAGWPTGSPVGVKEEAFALLGKQ
jgi:hypothetical protein